MTEPAHVALLLAAGGSRRLGHPKQLIEIDGIALIRRMALAALTTAPSELIVALGAETGGCRQALAGLRWREVLVSDWTEGMGSSLACAARQIDDPDAGVMVLGVDQPAVDGAHLLALLSRWWQQPELAVASGYAGTRGIPALFPASWQARLAALSGDSGARQLLRASEVPVIEAPQLALDIDTPEHLRALRAN